MSEDQKIDRDHAIEWLINRFIRQKGPKSWMKRRHGLAQSPSKDVQNKIHTVDRKRYFDYDVDFVQENGYISVNPATTAAAWLHGIIRIQGGSYYFHSLPQNNLFDDPDKAK